MFSANILLDSIDKVKAFVAIVTSYTFDVDLVSGRYTVDAKSIMGIFSLDLNKPVKLVAYTGDTIALTKDLTPFIVD